MPDVTSLAGWMRGDEPTPPTIDPDEARRAAQDILSRAEYREPERSLVDRAVEWVFNRVGDLFDALGGSGPGSVIGWLVVLALVGGAIWLLVRSLRVPLGSRVAQAPAVQYGTESHRDASVWLAEAERLAASGDLRGALRCRHQAMIARLIADAVLDDVPGRTAGECRDLIGTRVVSMVETARQVTDTFETVWYGGAAADGADYERFVASAVAIESAAADAPQPAEGAWR